MIRLNQLKLPVDHTREQLIHKTFLLTVPAAGRPPLLQGTTGSNLKVELMRHQALRMMIPNSN